MHTTSEDHPDLVADPSNVIARLEGVSVRFRAPEDRIRSFKEYAIRQIQRQVRFKEFWALQDVNLQIYHGEIFGIIGRNGAGKSTLLKVMSRVMTPTRGRVWIKGRVAPLLELGGGFHPELTGRENIFLNGTLLGHPRREIENRLDQIIEFAELGAFMEAPLRTYSSGMVGRLGFAVGTSWQPEILILDEVMSVGDEGFRRKCRSRMEEFRARGATTILVTHDMNSIRALCSRAAWMERGTIRRVGPVEDVVEAYLTHVKN